MIRLDQKLVEMGITQSRNIAQTLIKEGYITVDDRIITKPAFKVEEAHRIKSSAGKVYVGRAALKLKGFLEDHKLPIEGRKVLDVGASTGGFTEILLEAGAAQVTALDVGHDQLHERIKNDSRVLSIEGQDVRTYTSEPFDLLTCDVSFISIEYILEALDRLSSGDILILFKPQFEVGNLVKRNRSGVVLDDKAIALAQEKFEETTKMMGWKMLIKTPSKLEGKEGNVEHFYWFRKDS